MALKSLDKGFFTFPLSVDSFSFELLIVVHDDGQLDEWTDRQTERQRDRQMDRQVDVQTDRQINL